MKILLSTLFLFIIFLFNSCSNQSQNQKAIAVQSDTGVLIASNDQNLVLDSPVTKITTEVNKEANNQSEVSQTNIHVETKENEVASSQSHENRAYEKDPEFMEMPVVETEEKVEKKKSLKILKSMIQKKSK